MKTDLSELACNLKIFMSQMNNHQRAFSAGKAFKNQIDMMTLVDVGQLFSQTTTVLGQWGCNNLKTQE